SAAPGRARPAEPQDQAAGDVPPVRPVDPGRAHRRLVHDRLPRPLHDQGLPDPRREAERDPGRHPRRRHRPSPDGLGRDEPALLAADPRLRGAHRRADRAQHLVQRERADRQPAGRGARLLPAHAHGPPGARRPGGDPRAGMSGTQRTLLLINQYFWPDRAATAQLLADLAEDLAAAGWTVTALAGRGTYAPGRAGPLPARERFGDVAVRRVRCTDFGRFSRFGKLGRIADYATFLLAAALGVLLGPRPDVVVCLSTPPFVALLGALARLRGARFVYKVEDLYPDVAIAL